jgi:hypothetical protein
MEEIERIGKYKPSGMLEFFRKGQLTREFKVFD